MRRNVSILLFVCLACVGCGDGNSAATIQGKVTLDKLPIETGSISFAPQDGQTASEEVPIVAGQYTAQVPPGKKLVKIIGFKKVGERLAFANDPNSRKIDETVPIVPEKYNTNSDLIRDVSKSDTLDFDLTSAP